MIVERKNIEYNILITYINVKESYNALTYLNIVDNHLIFISPIRKSNVQGQTFQ